MGGSIICYSVSGQTAFRVLYSTNRLSQKPGTNYVILYSWNYVIVKGKMRKVLTVLALLAPDKGIPPPPWKAFSQKLTEGR